jgi:hypothetical protein
MSEIESRFPGDVRRPKAHDQGKVMHSGIYGEGKGREGYTSTMQISERQRTQRADTVMPNIDEPRVRQLRETDEKVMEHQCREVEQQRKDVGR